MQAAVSSVTVTAHAKRDAENSWVTRDSNVIGQAIHYWYNPNQEQTLFQVVECIEEWAQNDYKQQIQQHPCPCCFGSYNLNIHNLEARGKNYDRQTMTTVSANKVIHDEEAFTIRMRASLIACNIL